MTNLERIKAMTTEQMAEYIYTHDDELNDEICKSAHPECPFGDAVEPKNCKECIKAWLEREVEVDEERQ